MLYWFGTGNEEEGYHFGVHDCRVTFNEAALYRMAAIYAAVPMQWLNEH